MATERRILIIGYLVYSLLMLVYFITSVVETQPDFIPITASEDLYKALFSANFQGTWTKTSADIYGFLKNSMGVAKANFLQLETFDLQNGFQLKQVAQIYINLFILDPEFRDERFLRIIRPLEVSNTTHINFTPNMDNRQELTSIMAFNNFNSFLEFIPVNLTASISLNKKILTEKGIDYTAFLSIPDILQIEIKDEILREEGFSLKMVLGNQRDSPFRKSLAYSFVLVTIAFFGYYSAAVIFERLSEDPNYTKKLNMGTIVLVCLQDCFIFIYNIQLGFLFMDVVSYVFVLASYFIMFSFVDYRLLLYVWRYQNNRDFENLNEFQFRNKLYSFQMKVYFLIIAYVYFMWRYFIHVILVFLNSLLLIPQIVRNIREAQQPIFDGHFLVSFASLKYLVFLYLRGCPFNILEIRHYYILPYAGLAAILGSLALIYHQESFGSKFFLPKIFRRDQFDYFIEMKEFKKAGEPLLEKSPPPGNNGGEENVCSICLSSVCRSGDSAREREEVGQLQSRMLKRIVGRKGSRFLMKTPCGHVFHVACLAKWMEVKMECPSCRAPLPRII